MHSILLTPHWVSAYTELFTPAQYLRNDTHIGRLYQCQCSVQMQVVVWCLCSTSQTWAFYWLEPQCLPAINQVFYLPNLCHTSTIVYLPRLQSFPNLNHKTGSCTIVQHWRSCLAIGLVHTCAFGGHNLYIQFTKSYGCGWMWMSSQTWADDQISVTMTDYVDADCIIWALG